MIINVYYVKILFFIVQIKRVNVFQCIVTRNGC